jgi:hypothetical protein
VRFARVPGVTFETVPSKFSMSRVMYGVGINGQVSTVYNVSLAQCNISFVDVVDANGTVRDQINNFFQWL